MEIPDLVGLRLQDALQVLKECGLYVNARIVKYSTPGSKGLKQDDGFEERVIRQRIVGDGQIELVVSSFRYRPLDFEPYKLTHGEEG